MLGLGIGEMLLVAGLVLVVVGPDRLPHALRWAGKQYGQIRRTADELRRAFVLEADRQDAEDRLDRLRERQRVARERAEAEAQAAVDEASAQLDAVEAAEEPSILGGAVGQKRRFPEPKPVDAPPPADEQTVDET